MNLDDLDVKFLAGDEGCPRWFDPWVASEFAFALAVEMRLSTLLLGQGEGGGDFLGRGDGNVQCEGMLMAVINLIFLAFVVKYALDIVLAVWCNAVLGVPYVPTDGKLVKETVKRVKMKRGEKLVELGSGDGRVAREFARKYPIEAVGYEKNKFLLKVARWKWAWTLGKKGKLRFVDEDLFGVSLKGVDVVYMYLLPWMIEKLRTRLEGELRKGARVVSFDYPLVSEKFELVEVIGREKRKVAVYVRS